MARIELKTFTGGLVLKPAADDLRPEQLQDAQNVDITIQPGTINVRRGIDKAFTTSYGSEIDLFWADVLDTAGLLIRSDDTLYDGDDNPILYNLTTTAQMRFCEFAGWVILCNGESNWKYKQSMSLDWNGGLTSTFEDDGYADNLEGAFVIFTNYVTGETYRTTFGWETKHILDTYDGLYSPDVYTSSVEQALIDSVASPALNELAFFLSCNSAIQDDSSNSISVAATNASYTTGAYKISPASVRFGGNGYLTVSDDAALSPGSDTVFWDFYFRLDDLDADQGFFQHVDNNTSGAENGVSCWWLGEGRRLRIQAYDSGSEILDLSATPGIAADAWTHVCIFVGASYAYVYINGIQEAISSEFSPVTFPNYAADMEIGRAYNFDDNETVYLTGYVDKFRMATDTDMTDRFVADDSVWVEHTDNTWWYTDTVDSLWNDTNNRWESEWDPVEGHYEIELLDRVNAVYGSSYNGYWPTDTRFDYVRIYHDAPTALTVKIDDTNRTQIFYESDYTSGDSITVPWNGYDLTLIKMTCASAFNVSKVEFYMETIHYPDAEAEYEAPAGSLVEWTIDQPVQLGITAPDSAPSVATGAAGALTGTYSYKVTFLNNDGFESNPSAASSDVSPSSEKVELTDIPISSDPQVTSRRIYRTEAGGSTYKLLTTLTNNYATTYSDNTEDTSLGSTVETDHDVATAFSEVHNHESLLWGVDASAKNKIWYCNQFDEWEYFDGTNYEDFGSSSDETQVLETLAEYLCIVQDTKIMKYNTEEDPEEKSESLSQRGTPSQKAAIRAGDALAIIDASGIYWFDTVKDILFSQYVDPIFDPEGDNSDRISTSYLDNIAAGYLDEKLWVSYTRAGQTENDRTLVYDKEAKCFQGMIDKGFIAFAVDKDTKTVYAAGTDGYIYQLDTGNDDDSVAISWYAQTKDLAEELGGRFVYKRGGTIRVDLDPQSDDLTVAVYLDGTSRQSRTYDDSSRAVKEFRIDPDYDFYRLSVRFSGSTDAVQKVHGLMIETQEIS